ncbi:peroxiredoxin [Tropheryma whipplei]|uniref:peroxiredoxin n=1 Tax=Tropheryma whipplei TaxID=2039 RepID=UPI000000C891|nr:peroxiredoxin [Tropheryma whipplei]MCO8190249.1 peroxiredoxin [Tropheryma whipplei]CAD67181.1 conserved hypothetical protein [Tropheryma whipplei TW08/27]
MSNQVLPKGSFAPDFELVDQNGATVVLSEVAAKKDVVLFFFPLAFSGICTDELIQVRDSLDSFKSFEVFALSVDSKFTLRAYSESQGFSFALLSDFWPHGGVAKQFGAFLEDVGVASRSTFIVGRDLKIKASFFSGIHEPRDFSEIRAALAS